MPYVVEGFFENGGRRCYVARVVGGGSVLGVGRRETMTEDDILNGRLIIEVGIAPVRPAEFVIFRVCQKIQEAES
ncbi:MAG: hypothetical protein OEP95_11465 [Myxococcales bacterium]|nr:hypothetical protein [Myxococcales bacterium]